MKKKFIFILIFYSLIILSLGCVSGIYIHKKQPPIYSKIKNFLMYGSFSLRQKDKDKHLYSEFYSLDILKKNTQKELYNSEIFRNFVNLAATKTFQNLDNRSFKKKFFEENILEEEQILFQIPKKEIINNIKNTLFDINYNDESYDIYSVKYYDHYTLGVLHLSEKNNNKLLIYHQGHGGNSYDKEYFIELKTKYMNDGYDILNLNMPLLGINMMVNKYTQFPTNPYKKILPQVSLDHTFAGKSSHEIFRFFYDKDYPHKKPLAVFLSGNYFLIKKILSIKNYSDIKILGHSGGAISAIYNMSLIPEISKAYLSSGFLSKAHYIDYTKADWEYEYSDFIINNNYFDLIYHSLIDKNNEFNREIVFQFDNLDPACCNKPYSQSFADLINSLGKNLNLKLKAYTLNNNEHKINLELLFNEF